MKRLLIILPLLFLPALAHAATIDLGISSGSISFSDELVAGTTIRIYAEVTNMGDTDVAGYVSFFQGTVPIDDSQVISVRAGGVPEEVYVDFTVPGGDFNVRAEIRGTDPEDENPANDVAMTKLFTPSFDDDGDGVENGTDNCPESENASQADSDGDGTGNACDDDDDDDGLTDDVEKELGTSTTASDSDEDGTDDADDAYPTDAARAVVEPAPVAPVAPPVADAEAPADAPPPAAVLLTASDTDTEADVETSSTAIAPSGDARADFILSPKAIFSYARASWNTFTFTAVTPETDGWQYRWDFGDGVTSSRSEVRHTYSTSGEYSVTFRVTDPSGQASEDSTAVRVRFWTLQNRLVDILLASLSLLLICGAMAVNRLFRRTSSVSIPVPAIGRDPARGGGVADSANKATKLTVRNTDNE